MIKNNYEIIKGIVERKSNNKDLAMKGVYKGLSLTRFVYYKLCSDYMKSEYTHTAGAKAINRGHNHSLRGVKKYDELYDQEFFKRYKSLYVDCCIELLELEIKINAVIMTETGDSVPY